MLHGDRRLLAIVPVKEAVTSAKSDVGYALQTGRNAQSCQKYLNLPGASSVYRTVFEIERWSKNRLESLRMSQAGYEVMEIEFA